MEGGGDLCMWEGVGLETSPGKGFIAQSSNRNIPERKTRSPMLSCGSDAVILIFSSQPASWQFFGSKLPYVLLEQASSTSSLFQRIPRHVRLTPLVYVTCGGAPQIGIARVVPRGRSNIIVAEAREPPSGGALPRLS